MRRIVRTEDDDGGLDSLLDTMTNVVGILVLVLIVAQMGVADVVSRVVSRTDVTEQAVDQAQRALFEKQIARSELQQLLARPANLDVERQRQELERKRELLDRRKKLLAEKQEAKNQFTLKMETDKAQAAQNQQWLNDAKHEKQALEQQITTALNEKAELEARLATTPVADAPPPVEISIPDPRPAPTGAKPLWIIAAGNRIYPVNFDSFRLRAEQNAKQIIERFKMLRDPSQGIDPDEFAQRFSRLKDQDEFFDIQYYVQNSKYPRIRFIPRVNGGATVKELSNPRSRIQKRYIGRIDPQRFYGRFFVLPDSYEAYTLTRRAFDQAGILAGWEPQNETWLLTASIPGGIVLGPPPTPQPKPITPEPTQPPKKPLPPRNVID